MNTSEQFHDGATEAAFEARDFLITHTQGDSGLILGASLHLTAVLMSELMYRGELEPAALDTALTAMKATVEEMTDILRDHGSAPLLN
ncbi:MAG: hypothetical protein AAFY02_12455 [Pseudomonadota bacterium]